jgi:hypothetical protein
MLERDVPFDLGVEIDFHALHQHRCPIQPNSRQRNDGVLGTLGYVLIKRCETSLPKDVRLGGRPVSGLLKCLGVLVGQADAAALFGQHAAKALAGFRARVSILSHAAKSSSAIRPSSGGLLIFFKNRAKVAFLAPRSSA